MSKFKYLLYICCQIKPSSWTRPSAYCLFCCFVCLFFNNHTTLGYFLERLRFWKGKTCRSVLLNRIMGNTLCIGPTVSNESVRHLVYWTSVLALLLPACCTSLQISAAFHVHFFSFFFIFFLVCVFGMETGKAGASCPHKQ